MKKFNRILLLVLAALALNSCGNGGKAAKPAEGVERRNSSERDSTNIVSTNGGATSSGGQTDGANAISWKKNENGYTYVFPKRDDAGLAQIDEMYSFSSAMFEDQADDWFFGKTVRDAATGEVEVVWERAQSTLDALEKYGAIYRGDETRKVVYLTFDAGYEYGTTSKILDILKEKQAPATFFVNGYYVKSASDMIERMLAEGHIIGNHAVNHYDLTTVDVDTFLTELQGLEDLYYEKFPDAPPMIYFRPPSGNCNEWVLKLADLMGYTTVLWSWAYLDYDTENQPDVGATLEKVKEGLHNGCVYLFHPESQTNVDMLGELIDYIRGEGFEILPLADIS